MILKITGAVTTNKNLTEIMLQNIKISAKYALICHDGKKGTAPELFLDMPY
jgi:hypothetical protein